MLEGPEAFVDKTAVERIVRGLRESILSGGLAPGTHLRQQAVAEQFGTSRQPVRIALRQLQSDGLVTLIPNAGARVARLDAAELDEVYRIRECLEPAAIAASAPNLTDVQIETLNGIAEELNVESPSDWRRWHELDTRFHLLSYQAAGMPLMQRMIEGLWDVAQQYRRAYIDFFYPAAHEIGRAEHMLILDALQRRDGNDAARLLTTHIRRTRLALSGRAEDFETWSSPGESPL